LSAQAAMNKRLKMKKINSILVTEGNTKNALGIVRALGKQGLKVFVLAENKWASSLFSKYCQGGLILEKLDFNILLEFIKYNKIDLVMPVGTVSQKFFSEHRGTFSQATNLFISSAEQLTLAMDKQKTYDFAASIGIPVPKTLYPKTFQEVEAFANEISYPCVIKWLYEVGGNIVEYGQDKEDLLLKYADVCQRHSFNDETGLPMLQEYVEGKGVGHFSLYQNGMPIHSYQHLRLRETPPDGGASAAARTIADELLAEYSHRLLGALEWNGVAMVEFKRRSDGSLALMEINSKFWGSFDLGYAAGVNFPYEIVRLVQGEMDFVDTYCVGRTYHWPLDGDLKFAFHSPRRFLAVMGDLFNPMTKSNLWLLGDPKPTLLKLAIMLGGPVYKLFRKKSS
jgi:predicted ATP-grasp superfamily ATP-dependent carboligase